jgi:hypothetical protein
VRIRPLISTRTPANRVAIIARISGVVMMVVLTACGAPPMAPSPVVAGAWRGSFESGSDGPGTITLQLSQSGLDVHGTVVLSQDTITDVPGTFTGTLAASSLPTTMQFVVTYSYGFQCQGTFSGTLQVNGDALDGSFSGENCVRGFDGVVRATRSR